MKKSIDHTVDAGIRVTTSGYTRNAKPGPVNTNNIYKFARKETIKQSLHIGSLLNPAHSPDLTTSPTDLSAKYAM